MSHFPRSAGALLAVSSLPGPWGIGTFGEQAKRWCRFLREAGQRFWQILPLGPTGWGNSPYMSFSAFALSPYYLDLEALREQGLLDREEAEGMSWGADPGFVDYGALYRHREEVLRRAFGRFEKQQKTEQKPFPECVEFREFREKNAFWLEDYALFMALKKRCNGSSWQEWERGLKFREEDALAAARRELAEDMEYHRFVQWTAFGQWEAVKQYANSLGVSIIGDMPIYVSLDSADTWANGELFQLDGERRPLRAAGCPPDPFSAAGQLWGNPLYRWDVMEEKGFAWWLDRLRESLRLYDVVRIDHFRGFESYWAVPAGASDARQGEWVKGPGLRFVHAVNEALGASFPGAPPRIIAEDLGYLTAEVKALLEASGYPGMKILQFAFDSREAGDYMPYTYKRNCVVYTGTHDNPTTREWFASARKEDAVLALEYLGLESPRQGVRAFIREALSSVADLAVIPMQDYLELGEEARMNTPSQVGDENWRWRLQPAFFEQEGEPLAARMKRLAEITGRLPASSNYSRST